MREAIRRALSVLLHEDCGDRPTLAEVDRRRAYALLVAAWNNWGLEI